LVRILSTSAPPGCFFHSKMVEGWTARQLKEAVTDALVASVCPIGNEIARLCKDPEHLHGLINQGSQQAQILAEGNMREIREATGLR